jgi:hypothetical protein
MRYFTGILSGRVACFSQPSSPGTAKNEKVKTRNEVNLTSEKYGEDRHEHCRYLSSRSNTQLRMPKYGKSTSNRGEEKQKDTLSIRYEGPVLTGEKSVEQRQRDVVIRATSHRPDLYEKLDLYSNVEDCGPSLREHPPAIPGKFALKSESTPRKSGPGIVWRGTK